MLAFLLSLLGGLISPLVCIFGVLCNESDTVLAGAVAVAMSGMLTCAYQVSACVMWRPTPRRLAIALLAFAASYDCMMIMQEPAP